MPIYTFNNLKNPQNTTSGISDFILLAPVYDFEDDGIMCPEAPFATAGDRVTIKTAHTFKPDRAFAKIVCAPRKNKLDAATIGDVGFSKLDQTVDFFVPGSYKEVHEAMEMYMNTPLIGLVKDSECDAELWYQLGCDCVYAWLTVNFSTGTTVDGVKGYNGKLNCPSNGIRIYDVEGGPSVLGD